MAHRADGLNDIFENDVTVRKNVKTTGGTILNTPTDNKDITNKEYVDNLTSDLRDDSMADTLHRHSELSASDGTPNPALSVASDGKVGIGTTEPTATFHVKGTTYPTILGDRQTTTTTGISSAMGVRLTTSGDMVDGFGTGFTIQIMDNEGVVRPIGAVHAYRNGADNISNVGIRVYNGDGTGYNAMTVTNLGNVGIGSGVTNPTNKLHIQKSAVSGADYGADYDLILAEANWDSYINIVSASTRNGGILFSDHDRAKGQILYGHQNNNFRFFTNGAEVATIDSSGNLQTRGYKSSDGTAGATGTITLASITTITVKNGLITAWS